jgi:hypothetical protein
VSVVRHGRAGDRGDAEGDGGDVSVCALWEPHDGHDAGAGVGAARGARATDGVMEPRVRHVVYHPDTPKRCQRWDRCGLCGDLFIGNRRQMFCTLSCAQKMRDTRRRPPVASMIHGFNKSTWSLWMRGLSRPSRLAQQALAAQGIVLTLPPYVGRRGRPVARAAMPGSAA